MRFQSDAPNIASTRSTLGACAVISGGYQARVGRRESSSTDGDPDHGRQNSTTRAPGHARTRSLAQLCVSDQLGPRAINASTADPSCHRGRAFSALAWTSSALASSPSTRTAT
jgi:hypothetical protein